MKPMVKFKDMPYKRPDLEACKKAGLEVVERLKNAKTYEEAKAAFLEEEELSANFSTMYCLSYIRHSIDTRDKFYDEEQQFFNEASPVMNEYGQMFIKAMLESPFRKDFEEEYKGPMFLNAEIDLKAFSPEIIPEMQKENDLTQEYEKLLASAQIPFEDGVYTISQMTPFKTDPDDARRLAAWKAEGKWYKDNQKELDRLYDELTKLRDTMGRKMGYDGYTELGYYRMSRNCYTKDDVEKFREAVVKYVVPLADRLMKKRAETLGVSYPLSFADAALSFRSGNPRPQGSPDDILAAGLKFYTELSPETGKFFKQMRDYEMMDVLSTEGKQGGGYCEDIPDYRMPFIFANFNGTQGDVEVVTHEAGHAFADWMNRERVPASYNWPTMEACEVHSMSMEFFAWPWAEDFFGPDADKYRYSHLASAIEFIPYGTMVDHFQHIVYEKPQMTPAERHAAWKELLGIYMPWMLLDGDIPFYADGEGWQRQHHIYGMPFYYIDYCLAQTVSLEFWAKIQKGLPDAWKYYMAYTKQGGSAVFTDLLANAGLDSPFDGDTLRGVCEDASAWLDAFEKTHDLK